MCCPFECLRLRSCHGVWLIGPVLTTAGMATQSSNRESACHENFTCVYEFVFLQSRYGRNSGDLVGSGPAGWREQLVETVGVRSRSSNMRAESWQVWPAMTGHVAFFFRKMQFGISSDRYYGSDLALGEHSREKRVAGGQ
jgi:hypothetical protein